MTSRIFWIRWLEAVHALVLIYAGLLVFAGSVAGSLFSAFGFGPPEAIDTDDVQEYLKLPTMVLGAVLAGWTLTLLHPIRGPLQQGSTWVIPVVARSLTLWFVLDTGMSLVLGHPTHALFNMSFGLALALPLVRLRSL